MNQRLYYANSYLARFSAMVVEETDNEGRAAVVLEHTCFYPDSGGQPSDRGWLNDVAVVEVFVRDTDEAVVHVLERKIVTPAVSGRIAWRRRFDHMQQHSGQHILSQAILRTAKARTVGFHLGETSVAVDLDRASLSGQEVAEAERLANQVIWEDRPVATRWVDRKDLPVEELRGLPRQSLHEVRLVEVADFDVTACGGTHVRRTGEIGQVKVLKVEKQRGKTRILFVCGQRALERFGNDRSIIDELTASLTTGAPEIVRSVSKMQAELRQSQRELKKQQTALLQHEGAELLRQSRQIDGIKLVAEVFSERDPAELRALVQIVAGAEDTIGLFGNAGERGQLLFARSAGAPGDMRELLSVALASLDKGRGGGTAAQAQAGGFAARVEELGKAIGAASQRLKSSD